MKIKNYHIERLMEIIERIENDSSLTKRVSLKIMNLKDSIAKPHENYMKVKNDLIIKYGTRNDKTGITQVFPSDPKFIDFVKEIDPIGSEVIELSFTLVTIDDLPDDMKISTNDLKLLQLIKEEIDKINEPKPLEFEVPEE